MIDADKALGSISTAPDASPVIGVAHIDDQIPSSEEDDLSPEFSDREAEDAGQQKTTAGGAPGAQSQATLGTNTEDGDTGADDTQGVLPRDKQRRTAFYDYASEKQMSHSEAKQFYQRHQLESQYGGSQAGDGFSPVIRAKTLPVNLGGGDGIDYPGRADSIRSRKSNISAVNQGPRLTLPIGLSQAEQSQEPSS